MTTIERMRGTAALVLLAGTLLMPIRPAHATPGAFVQIGANVDLAATAAVGNDVHVACILKSGQLLHQHRRPDGTWTGWLDVAPFTRYSLPIENRMSLSVAGASNGEVHVAVIANWEVYHALRFTNGYWSNFNWVDPATGNRVGVPLGVSMAGH
jgi:hypothetical protein